MEEVIKRKGEQIQKRKDENQSKEHLGEVCKQQLSVMVLGVQSLSASVN